jgi:hypothetical protein
MPKICMKKNAVGCDDGIHATEYMEGHEYEVSDSLAKDFLSLGACSLVVSEKKAEQEAPKNKAYKHAPKNKSDLGDE